MKIQILLLATILVVLRPHSIQAQNDPRDRCDANPNIPINVTSEFEEPVYNYSVSLPQLQALSRDAIHVIPEALTLGLTHYQPVLNVNAASSEHDLRDGSACVRIEHVDITFGYRNVTVYIAQEIPQGSCGFQQVMIHEQKHVAVQKQILQNYIPILKQWLQQYLAENGTLQDSNYGAAVTWLRDNVTSVVQGAVNDIASENFRLQRNIDTVEEYARIGNSCNGQLHQAVQSFMQRRR